MILGDKKMKLKEWSEKTGVKYLTAYRWFKDGKFPCPIYQTDSGTIIVNDESLENQSTQQLNSDVVISDFLKNVVEFSKANLSIEDFAAFILSNYILKNKSSIDIQPKIKPSKEEIQKHYQQFIPQKVKPPINIFIADKSTFDSCDSIKDNVNEDYIEDKIQEVLDLLRLDDSKLDEEKIKLLEALKSYNKSPASEKSNIITTTQSSTLK
jgi:hypothetical protein